MADQFSHGQGSFDFIDRLIDLFHHPVTQKALPKSETELSLNQQFKTALTALEETIEKQQHEKDGGKQFGWKRTLNFEDEESKKHKEKKIHDQIRMDVESIHQHLHTGISAHDLDQLKGYLAHAAETVSSGEKSHEVLPRCRAAILKRFHHEAGLLALEEMDDYLGNQHEAWPTIVPRDPSLSPDEAEAIVEHNRMRVRKNFLNYNIHQSSFLIVGIVEVWKSDYPEANSNLWKSVVFEAVATALRAKLMHLFTTRIRHDRKSIENKATELIGAKVTELKRTLQGGVTSLNDAHRVVSSSLKILDEVIPNIAWQHLQKVLPETNRFQEGQKRDNNEEG
jgi:hypothetical protein